MTRSAMWLVSAFVLSMAACQEEINVSVDCQTVAGPAVDCKVTETKGKGAVNVCWDFAVDCANGTKVAATGNCTDVKDGATVLHKIPGEKLANAAACDKAAGATVTNIKLTKK